jgi:hypothetical protein
MAEKIEKKISRAMRWLERCTLACRGESYGNALMDIECARVDFDSAREEIWNTAHKQYNPVSGKIYLIKIFRTAMASAVILLSTAAPLSFVENRFSVIATDSSLEWVNSDEKVLLKNLREQLSNANSGWGSDLTDSPVILYSEAPNNEIKSTQKSSLPGKSEKVAISGNNFTDEQPFRNGKTGTKNETHIFTLLKIGENALKNKPSAVIVER